MSGERPSEAGAKSALMFSFTSAMVARFDVVIVIDAGSQFSKCLIPIRRKTRLVLSVSIKVCTGKVSRERTATLLLLLLLPVEFEIGLCPPREVDLVHKKTAASQPVIFITRIGFVSTGRSPSKCWRFPASHKSM